MNTRAGKKLWRRKPSVAPKTIAEKIAAFGFPSESAITENVTPAMPQTPAASPSSPSRKLTMFITATIQMTVKGPPTQAGRSTTPRNGKVKWSTHTPKTTGIEAASTCPPSFSHQASPRKSSIAPTAVATAQPISTPRTGRVRSRNASDGTMIPKNIAIPPSRGIGIRWMRRSSGWSTAPKRLAIPATAGVSATTMNAATTAP